jgi:opacity protein-like surface antigen
MNTRRVTVPLLLLALGAAAAPAAGQPFGYRKAYDQNQIRLRGGLFTPAGEGAYWSDKERDFSGRAEDFEDGVFAVDYSRALTPFLSVEAGFTGFEGSQDQRYLDFTDAGGAAIEHRTTVDTSRFDLGVRVHLGPKELPILPYVAAGGALVSYTLTESGEFVDFNPPPPTIFDDTFTAEGEAFGWYAAAGLEANLGATWSLFAEYRHVDVEDDLGGDFSEFGSLDLSGREITAGIGLRF